MTPALPKLYLVRHGETEWTITGQHTGRTDIPLTSRGEENARRVGERLKGLRFDQVLSSPLQRARRTCELAGYGPAAQVEPDLVEWGYGDYEGRQTADIQEQSPGWNLFRDGCPGGEMLDQVRARCDRVVARLRGISADALVFAHKDVLRVLAVCWLDLPARAGRHFVLTTASLSVLGYDHSLDEPAIHVWNDASHVLEERV